MRQAFMASATVAAVVIFVFVSGQTFADNKVDSSTSDKEMAAFAAAREGFENARSLWVEQLTSYFTSSDPYESGRLEYVIQTSTYKRLDERSQALIKATFEIDTSFADVQKRTFGLIKWVEWPQDWSYPDMAINGKCAGIEDVVTLAEDVRRSPENVVIVLFQHVQLEAGDLYVMQNSFWHADRTHPRIRSWPFSVLIHQNELLVKNLRPRFEEECNAVWNYPPFVLGIVPAPTGLPWVFLVEGPMGSGGFIELYGFCFDEESRSWVRRAGQSDGDDSDVHSYAYDHKTCVLILDPVIDDDGAEFSRSFDLHAVIKESLDSGYWRSR